MKNLTPAKVTMSMFVVIGLLIAAYVVKTLYAVDDAPTTRNIPLTIGELRPGTRITESQIGLGPYPINEISSSTLLSSRAIVGRIVKETIPGASPILADQLYQFGEQPSLDVTPGMRAVSVNVAEGVDAVDGLIKSGQYVDVHLTVTRLANDPRLRQGLTLTLFKGVQVLAIHRTGQDRNSMTPNSVTLELTPEQANILILAREKGTITLSYNPDGKGEGVVDVPDENRATLEEILGLKPIPEPVDNSFTSEIYRSQNRQVMEFEDGKLTGASSTRVGLPAQRSATTPNGTNTELPQNAGRQTVPPPPSVPSSNSRAPTT